MPSKTPGDLPSFLKELVNRYLISGDRVNLLLRRFRYASEGKTFSISKILGLQVLSAFPEIRGYLQSLLVEIHDHVFNTKLETQSRTNELLSIAELACQCGHFNLGRAWLQEAVLALRGYGYRKDSTVGLLIEALEEVSSLQPKLLQQRVADHEEGFGYEDSYKDKFEARFQLLQAAVEQENQNTVYWIAKHIRQFVLTEVPPTERLSFVEIFNKYVLKISLSPIQKCSTYPKNDNNTSNTDFEIPAYIELDGEEILTNTLAAHTKLI